MTYQPDLQDRTLLERIQDGVPLTADIWDSIGRGTGMNGPEVLFRLRRLQEEGVLRSIGPILEPEEVGLGASTLVALRVPQEQINTVADIVNEYPEVSHNYRRDHAYNLWFTLSCPTWDVLDQVLDEIRTRSAIGTEDLLNLPRRKRFKIGVHYHIQENEP